MPINQWWKCMDFATLANARSEPAYTFAPSSISNFQVIVLKVSRRTAQDRLAIAIRAIGRLTIGALNKQG